jgi:[pyruvate, water dikinase]-phosphate phosphotransferase / [pyruvate, water dikinase] kinase
MVNDEAKSVFYVYAVSDATGGLAHNLAKAAVMQFEEISVKIVRKSRVSTPDLIRSLISEVGGKQAVILFTMVSNELRQVVLDEAKKAGVVAMDVMGPALDMLAHYFHKLPSAEPGLQYKSARDYFNRTEAIEFTVRHDEGLGLETLTQADIILLGVSRTSKTPLSIYLAYQGYRCANVPVMSGIPVPQKLETVDRRKIVGLTIAEEKLIAFRSTRLKKMGRPASEDYAQKEYVSHELKFAHDLFQKLGVRVVDVTGKSIEEIASEIISDSYFMP